MRKVWALGVMNLKPGFLCFYCWTRDFIPQAQVQTHAQIWVRLLHLPQEYRRKKTLYEIALGLGTPLTIDEAIQQRRFGLFARVLVDVDLFQTMFDSVIVEREGHALSIQVHYEKKPLFCANCKMLGHNLQNCMKINSTNTHEAPSKITKMVPNTANATKKQNMSNMPGKLAEQPYTKHLGKMDHNVTSSSGNHASSMYPVIVGKNINVLNQSVTQEGVNEDVTVVPVIQKENNPPSTLAMHNAFKVLLEAESEIPVGEASPVDQVLDISSMNKAPTILEPVAPSSKENDCLTQDFSSEIPSDLDKRSCQTLSCLTNNQLLNSAYGRLSFPIPGSSSLVQNNTPGRQSFPGVVSVSTG
jgi:hypothetical protein